jgi:hypothetical protein
MRDTMPFGCNVVYSGKGVGGNRFLWNVSSNLQNYNGITSQQTANLHNHHQEPQISQCHLTKNIHQVYSNKNKYQIFNCFGDKIDTKRYTGRSRFTPGICSRKMSQKSKLWKLNTEFPFKTVYFLGVGGLTASSYIAYDCTIHGHTDL